jgi:hypothetical protein
LDWLTLPFRVLPDMPLYLVAAVLGGALLGFVVLGLVWLLHGRERARDAVPYVRRATLAWIVLWPLSLYLGTFLLALLAGAPFG